MHAPLWFRPCSPPLEPHGANEEPEGDRRNTAVCGELIAAVLQAGAKCESSSFVEIMMAFSHLKKRRRGEGGRCLQIEPRVSASRGDDYPGIHLE